MNTEDKTNYIADFFSELHKNLHSKIRPYEDSNFFIEDEWKKENLGSGTSIVVDQGSFFDKAGINFSKISGESLPISSVGNKDNGILVDIAIVAFGEVLRQKITMRFIVR